jgi:rhodanese-related sulfurtransferase
LEVGLVPQAFIDDSETRWCQQVLECPLTFYAEPALEFVTQNLWLIAIVVASGLMLIWPEIQNFSGGSKTASTLEATQLINQRHALVLDLRRAQDFELGHLPDARHIPADELATKVQELSRFRSRPVILVTTGNGPNSLAIKTLQQQGFTDVFLLKGGITAWIEAQLPVVRPATKS